MSWWNNDLPSDDSPTDDTGQNQDNEFDFDFIAVLGGPYGVVIQALFGDVYDSTIGNVFANGFDLDCWNVSASPSMAAQWYEEDLMPYFEGKMQDLQNADNKAEASQILTTLHRDLKVVVAHQLFHKSESNADCSREGNQIMSDAAQALADNVHQMALQMQSEYSIQYETVQINATQFDASGLAWHWKGQTNINAEHYKYSVKTKSLLRTTKIGGLWWLLLLAPTIYKKIKEQLNK